MKIRPVGTDLFYANGWTDRRTDLTKLIVAFRNFANAHNKIRGHGRVELYLYLHSGPHRACNGITLPNKIKH